MRTLFAWVLLVGCAGAPQPSCPPFRVDVAVPGNRALDRAALEPIVGPLQTVRAGPFAYYDLFEDRLDTATSGLLAAYYDRGYADAVVRDPVVELSDDRGTLHITLPVVEGTRYRIGSVRIVEVFDQDQRYDEAPLPFGVEAEPLPPPATPERVPGVRAGDWFSRRRIVEAIEAIDALYEEHGYALVEVEPLTDVDRDRARLDITLSVRRHETYVIDAIEVLDEEHGPRDEDTGIEVGQPYVGSRVRAALEALTARHPDREVRFRIQERDDGRALLCFMLLER